MIATGASWRTDGVGRYLDSAFEGFDLQSVVSVDAILKGALPAGRVIIHDDDHYYLGSARALKLRAENIDVTLVTPESRTAGWSYCTTEQFPLIQQLLDANVKLINDKGLVSWDGKSAKLECIFSHAVSELDADCVIPLTARQPNDGLFYDLKSSEPEFINKGGISMQLIGDCAMPGIIATAIYDGHKAARELGAQPSNAELRRDRIVASRLEPFV